MKLLLLLTFAFTTFSTLVSSYGVDLSLKPTKPRDVFEKKLYGEFTDSKRVTLYVAKYDDGFEEVLEDTEKVWSDKKDFKCEYVKVFYWDDKPEAVKLGLRTRKFLDAARKYDRSEFLLKSDGKWTKVERKVYFNFLRDRKFDNYAQKNYEKDERFKNSDPTEEVEVALRPLWADMRVKPKDVPKQVENVEPIPPKFDSPPYREDEPAPPVADPLGTDHVEDPNPLEVVKPREDPEEPKKPGNLKGDKDSFLTLSVLPAVLLAFFAVH